MYLVTKWFGTFLYKGPEIIDYVLFPKDVEQISEILIKIQLGEVLEEEKQIAAEDMIVCERRLFSLGEYKPRDIFYDSVLLDSEEYGYPIDLLQDVLCVVAQHFINEDLKKDDYQIVQMINTIDDLLQTANLLQERLNTWNVFPTKKKNLKPLQDLIIHVEDKINLLEQLITSEIQLLAPNTVSLTGPLLAARLLSVAGTMDRLARFPASTIQLLGAEKAFFRFKKEGGRPPKHGLIFQHPLVNRAPRNIRGRIARIFASKIMLAIRADVFTKRDISSDLKQSLQTKVAEIKKNQ